MRSWEEALQEHKEVLLSAGYREENIVGIFAYGSQNYRVETENSDWDTKAIVIPTYKELVLHPRISEEIHLMNDEHCEVKDIREIINMFKKQNINFLEILFTEYKWFGNPFYKVLWEVYFTNWNEHITHYSVNKTIQSICGQAIHTIKQNPMDGKKIANGYRLLRFLEKYLTGENYRNCIVLPEEDRRVIIDLKTQVTKPNEEYGKNLIAEFEKIKERKYVEDKEIQSTVDDLMERAAMHFIQYYLTHYEKLFI